MKTTRDLLSRARAMSRCFLLLGTLAPLSLQTLPAAESVAPPLLEFTSGLPGQQVRLSWAGQPGARYAVEKSTTLASGGAGGWKQVALVEGSGADTEWLDPVATTTKAFYRVSQPVAEVFSISPPVLSPTGGALVIHGQCIPAGSFLVIQIPGQAPILVPLSALGNGEWQALVGGTFAVGDEAAAVSIRDANGISLVTLNQPLEITPTGRALDSAGSLPPASPVVADLVKPIPSIGIVVKSNTGRPALERSQSPGPDDDCDDLADDFPMPQSLSNPIPGIGIVVKRNHRQPGSHLMSGDEDGDGPADSEPSLIGAWLTKKGYDYYQAKSNMNSAGLHHNPYFAGNQNAGEMPKGARLANNKHPDLMKREMGPGAISPASSGLPGEVSFQFCALALDTPAGPPLELVHTYRSKPPVSVSGGSGTAGSHWESCYDISIEPIPTTAGSSAPRLLVRDGGCRADMFYRQPDGTYRCDGMFREGSFTGDTFTLTFADKGTWTFNPLSDPNAPGRIAAITDRNNVALSCVYNGSGQLESVSSQFGQSLTMTYGSDGSLNSVSDHSGRSVYYTYYGRQDPDGNEGDLKSISAPQVGSSSPFGPTTFTYLTGQKIPELNGNLLSITDGANRLLEAFTYSSQSDPTAVDFDACATHDRHRTSDATGAVLGELVTLSYEPLSSGGYAIIENDELGRVTQTTFDRQHREISVREYTGFAAPGTFLTATSFPLTGKLYDTDPDFFETTCAYNADSSCTRITRPDGSQELTTYDRDFRRDCPVRERGNARVMTLRTPSGERRTVTCDYQPDFGTPESARPGNPIKGITVKGGRNPGGDIVNSVGRDRLKGWDGTIKGNRSYRGGRKGWDGTIKGNFAKEEGGRHTPFHHKTIGASPATGISAGAIVGIAVGAVLALETEDQDCDGFVADRKGWDGTIKGKLYVTRMVSAYGQVSTFGYDANGNRTSYTSPLPSKGQLYQYNSLGQCTRSTVLNGPDSSFTDECVYDPTTHFLSSVVSDGSGLALTTSWERDNLGRITRFVDPRGSDWLYSYNPLDQCIQIQSPPVPSRISTNFTFDSGGRVCRCDVGYHAPDGSVVTSNPVYSTFFVRDTRCRLVQVATEERPVNSPPSALAPAAADLASYDVCDITLDNAGQVSRLSTPAACREQATDLVCDFTYTERGQLHRCIEGGLGTAGAVTTEYQYDSRRAVVRCTLVLSGVPSPQSLCTYDGFRRLSSVTDPMGNVTEYAYGNDGSVTTSVYGQLNDLPGSAGNVLLEKHKGQMSNLGSNPMYQESAKHAINTKGTGATKDGRTMPNPFFEVETEDDTLTVERFIPGSTAPPATEVTVIDRSPAGLVQSVTRNGDLLMSCEYDTAGRRDRCADGACSVALTLDACGNPTSATRTDISGVPGVASKTFTTSCVRDPLGRVTSCTDGGGNVASATFDSLSRPVSITAPGRPPLLFAYDGGTASAPFSVQVSCDLSSTGSPQVLSSSLVRCGEVRSTTDANGYSQVCTRDSHGRANRCDFPDGTFEETTYDLRSLPVEQRCKDGTFTACVFDSNGRPTSVTRPGSLNVAPTSLAYDGLGRLVRCEHGTSLVTFAFDSCGNPVSETTASGTIASSFNHRGRIGITYPDGAQFTESRNALGKLLAITTATGGSVVTMDYAGHRVIRSVQGNGVVTTWNFRADTDAGPPGAEDFSFDACVSSTVTSPSSAVLSDERVFRDRSQSVTRCETRFAAGTDAPYRSRAFTLDGLGRITACVTERRETAGGPMVPESSVSYVIGTDGRRRSEVRNGVTGDYTLTDLPPPRDFQMGQYTTWPGSSLPLEWDDNGNLSVMTKGTSRLDFVHNDAGQLIAVNDRSGTTVVPVITYTYDALGRRASRVTQGTPSVSTTFVYDGDDCIQELGSGNLADMTFVSSGGVKHCISTRNGTIYYPHGGEELSTERKPTAIVAFACTAGSAKADSITLVTSAAGAPVERFDRDDACKPIFLTSDGLPSSDTSSSIGLRWLAPDCAWEPEIGMFTCPGGVYSPDLGTAVSKEKAKPRNKEYVGHVTLIKQ